MRLEFISMFVLLIALSCRSKKEASISTSPRYTAIGNYAQDLYGADYLLSFNCDSSYVVVYTYLKNRPSDVSPTLNYQILQCSPLEIIHKDIVPRAQFAWVDSYTIEVEAEKGISSKDEESIQAIFYRYHAKNRKKYTPGVFGNKN